MSCSLKPARRWKKRWPPSTVWPLGSCSRRSPGGAVTLMTAAHMEDSGENLRKYRNPKTAKGE